MIYEQALPKLKQGEQWFCGGWRFAILTDHKLYYMDMFSAPVKVWPTPLAEVMRSQLWNPVRELSYKLKTEVTQ